MVMAGIRIILSTPASTRKAFVVGIALIFGLSVDILPQMYSHLHPWIKPLFSSSLTLATVLAIVLNQLFSLGKTSGDQGSGLLRPALIGKAGVANT
jgi:xanthine permease XanP